MICLDDDLAFVGTFSLNRVANQQSPASPFGAFVVLVPVFRALLHSTAGSSIHTASPPPSAWLNARLPP
jgi:hypothetical protein